MANDIDMQIIHKSEAYMVNKHIVSSLAELMEIKVKMRNDFKLLRMAKRKMSGSFKH